MPFAIPDLIPGYASSPVHYQRAFLIPYFKVANINEKRLIFDNYLQLKNSNQQYDSIKPPIIQVSLAQQFYSCETTQFSPQQHYILLHAFYWYGTNLKLFANFLPASISLIQARDYFMLNHPQLQQHCDAIDKFKHSNRFKIIQQYYLQLGIFNYQLLQISAPILSDYASLTKSIGGCLMPFDGTINGAKLILDGNLAVKNGIFYITAEERSMVNIICGPLAGSERMLKENRENIYIQNDFPLYKQKHGYKALLSVQLMQDPNIPKISKQLDQQPFESEIQNLLEQLISCQYNQQQGIINTILEKCENKPSLLQQVKKLQIALGKSILQSWTKQILQSLASKDKNCQFRSIKLQEFRHQDSVNFWDEQYVLVDKNGQYGLPQIPSLTQLQLALEKIFNQ